MKIIYINGDRAEYTGKSKMLYGEMCYEVKMLEGHEKGKLKWTYRAPK